MTGTSLFNAIEARDIADGVNGSRIELLFERYLDLRREIVDMQKILPWTPSRIATINIRLHRLEGMRTVLLDLGFTHEMLNQTGIDI